MVCQGDSVQPRTELLRRSSRRRMLALATGVLAVLIVVGCGRIPSDQSSTSQSPQTPNSAKKPRAGSTGSGSSKQRTGDARSSPSSTPSGGQDCSYTRTGKAARKVSLPPSHHVPGQGTATVVIKLTAGKITVKLNRAAAPCTVNSFVSLAKQAFYDKTKCPRLTTDALFLLQCGDPTASGDGGPGYSFPDELDGNETYPKGTVAMANNGPNANGSGFFLVYRKSKIDPKFTVFGRMDKAGLDVLSKIAAKGDDGSDPQGGGKPKAEAKIVSVHMR